MERHACHGSSYTNSLFCRWIHNNLCIMAIFTFFALYLFFFVFLHHKVDNDTCYAGIAYGLSELFLCSSFLNSFSFFLNNMIIVDRRKNRGSSVIRSGNKSCNKCSSWTIIRFIWSSRKGRASVRLLFL